MKRIHYFDLLRCTCFCFIIFYHLLFQLYLSGICPVERLNPLFSNSNMHLATLGVAVFFMLSGASLSYTAKENFSLAKYYKKRFLRILIPFYILYIVYFLFLLFQSHSVHNIFPEGIPAWRIVFTFLGMDSWVSMHGISTGLKITILAVAFWISAACMEPVLEKGNGRFLRTISNYSYEVFLVHHIIIYFITPRAIPYMRGMVGVLGLFLVELLLMAVLGFLLKSISDQCIAALSNLTAVENKR